MFANIFVKWRIFANIRSCKSKMANIRSWENRIFVETLLWYRYNVQIYVGQAGNTFKERFNNHLSSLKHRKFANSTELSKCVWNLTDSNIQYTLNWSKMASAPTYKPSTGKCNLCNLEKTLILFSKEELLNSRNEIMNKCRHRNKYLLQAVT